MALMNLNLRACLGALVALCEDFRLKRYPVVRFFGRLSGVGLLRCRTGIYPTHSAAGGGMTRSGSSRRPQPSQGQEGDSDQNRLARPSMNRSSAKVRERQNLLQHGPERAPWQEEIT